MVRLCLIVADRDSAQTATIARSRLYRRSRLRVRFRPRRCKHALKHMRWLEMRDGTNQRFLVKTWLNRVRIRVGADDRDHALHKVGYHA